VQSHEVDPTSKATILNFLPALPKAWSQGSISGLKMRGGFEVDFQWQNGAITRAVVQSKLGNPCVIRYGGKNLALKTKAGKKYIFDAQMRPVS
jgi:alpha-L-fucosidase 2